MRIFPLPLVVAGVLVLGACESPPTETEEPPLRAEHLRATLGGTGAQDTIGAAVALTALVTRPVTQPIAGVALEWRVATEAGGTIAPATGTTDASGRSSTVWTLGTRAGEHRVELRATYGGTTATLATATATVMPGAATSVGVVDADTARTIAAGTTSPVALTATDRHGNAVPQPAIGGTWVSLDPEVVSVAADGTLKGENPGRATVEYRTASDTLRVRVVVPGAAMTFHAVNTTVYALASGGGRLLATGIRPEQRVILEYRNGQWESYTALHPQDWQLRVLPSGEAFILAARDMFLAEYGLYRSTTAGAWELVPTPSPTRPGTLASAGNVISVATSPQYGTARAFIRQTGGWVEAPVPAPADSSLYLSFMAATSTSDLLLSGGVGAELGTARTYLARTSPTGAVRLTIPAELATSGLLHLLAHPGGAEYAMFYVAQPDGFFTTPVMEIAGNSLVPVANPFEGEPALGMGLDASGALYLGNAATLARRADGGWTTWTLRQSTVLTGAIHVRADGTIWAAGSYWNEPGIIEIELIDG